MKHKEMHYNLSGLIILLYKSIKTLKEILSMHIFI